MYLSTNSSLARVMLAWFLVSSKIFIVNASESLVKYILNVGLEICFICKRVKDKFYIYRVY